MESTAAASVVTPTQRPGAKKTPSPRHCKKVYKCGYHDSAGLGISTHKECSMCCVHPHSLCADEAFREISSVDNDASKGIFLCSVSCFRFSKIEAVTSEVVKTQRAELLKKNKEQLKKEVRELNVKVNCRVNGASRDASKEVIVVRVLEKKSYSFIHHGLLKFLKLMTMLQISFC
jgi:hypothetical protein